MSSFDRDRATALGWFPTVLSAARERGLTESVTRLSAAEQRLRDGRLIAVVCGEFKRGKSTLLNALLECGEPDLFPTDSMFATSIVSTVEHGPDESVVAMLETADGRVDAVPISRAEIAGYVTESANPQNTKKARALSIFTPNPKLESGLQLVDTPGVGGVYAAHTAATLAYLPTADAIVFVVDATQPLAESELEFLRQAAASVRVTDDQDGLLFVLTKIDSVDYESVLANTRTKLADVTGRPASQIDITPVSAHAKLAHLRDGDDEDLELSNFPEFERRLWRALGRRRTRLLLGGALSELDTSTAALVEPLVAEQRALRDETPARVASMVADAERREAEFARLTDENSGWGRTLAQELDDCKKELLRAARSQIGDIWDSVNTEYLFNDGYLRQPEKLVDKITERTTLVIGEVNELATRRVSRIQQDLADKSGLAIERRRFDSLPPVPVPHVEVTGTLERPTSSGKMRKIRDMSFGGGIGSSIGGMIGTFVFPAVGTALGMAIGGLIGGGAGLKSSFDSARQDDLKARRQSLRTELAPLRRSQSSHVEEAVDALMGQFARSITTELRSRTSEARDSAKDEAARLRRAGKQTEKETQERLAALDRELAPLIRMRADIEAMVGRLDTPDPDGGAAAPPPTPGPVRDSPSDGAGAPADDWADE